MSNKFKFGDRVSKISGAKWRGTICGTYSTALTPEGYCVESEFEKGSVQIYPASALSLLVDDFKYETCRIEWWVTVRLLDQYGNITTPADPYYVEIFPTKEAAEKHLEEISVKHKYLNKRVWKEAAHEYTEIAVEQHFIRLP